MRPNKYYVLLYYFKSFNESLRFLLKEKDVRNFEEALGAAMKIKRNIFATRKI